MKRLFFAIIILMIGTYGFAQYTNDPNYVQDAERAMSLSLYEDGNGNKGIGLYLVGVGGSWPNTPAPGLTSDQLAAQSFYHTAAGEGALGVFLISPSGGGFTTVPMGTTQGSILIWNNTTGAWEETTDVNVATGGVVIGDGAQDWSFGATKVASGTAGYDLYIHGGGSDESFGASGGSVYITPGTHGSFGGGGQGVFIKSSPGAASPFASFTDNDFALVADATIGGWIDVGGTTAGASTIRNTLAVTGTGGLSTPHALYLGGTTQPASIEVPYTWTGSAEHGFRITVGSAGTLAADDSILNVGGQMIIMGDGEVRILDGTAGTDASIGFYGQNDAANEGFILFADAQGDGILTPVNLTATHTWTLPDLTGAIVLSEAYNTGTWLGLTERSSDPTQPAEGQVVIWMSDGTGKGDDGDLMVASTAGGVTNYGTLFDHSAGAAW